MPLIISKVGLREVKLTHMVATAVFTIRTFVTLSDCEVSTIMKPSRDEL